MIISILNEKGGVGKTTLSTNLAVAMKLKEKTILLVDSDPQGSARDWHANNEGSTLQVIGLDRTTLDKDVVHFVPRFDYIIIDGAPQLTNMAIKAILCSDVILIPVQPSPYDIWASQGLVELIKQRQNITNGKPKAAFVINRQIVGTTIGKEVREALEQYELPVFIHGTSQRIIYAVSASRGHSVLEIDPYGPASVEINQIIKELEEFIHDNPRS